MGFHQLGIGATALHAMQADGWERNPYRWQSCPVVAFAPEAPTMFEQPGHHQASGRAEARLHCPPPGQAGVVA